MSPQSTTNVSNRLPVSPTLQIASLSLKSTPTNATWAHMIPNWYVASHSGCLLTQTFKIHFQLTQIVTQSPVNASKWSKTHRNWTKPITNRHKLPCMTPNCSCNVLNSSQLVRIQRKSFQVALLVSQIIANLSFKSPNRLQIVTNAVNTPPNCE